jgi:DNA-binding winged helix-turn-helix (wHTH) protein
VGILRVGQVEIDLDARQIKKDGIAIVVQPRVFDLLQYLIEHKERVVTKSELLEKLWAGQAVVPDVLTTAFYSLRRVLGDSSKRPRYIRTVHGVGYQLVADVDVADEALGGGGDGEEKEQEAFPVLEARHATFIGRHGEKALFDEMLAEKSAAPQLLFLHGPPGIGKTALIQELVYRCRRQSSIVDYAWLSGVASGPLADGLVRALAQALNCPDAPSASFDRVRERLTQQAQARRPLVIFLDDVHALQAADEWIRQELWPALPSHAKLVLAGRRAPSARWRCDPAWNRSACAFELSAFTEEEAREFFAARGGAPETTSSVSDTMWRLVRGHPLALAIAADAVLDDEGRERRALKLNVLEHHDVIETLVEWFTDQIDVSANQRVLEAACLFDEISLPMLGMLDDPQAAPAGFEWLTTLPFVERSAGDSAGESADAGVGGLVRVHALVREAVITRLARRDPRRLADLFERGHRFCVEAVSRAPDASTRLRAVYAVLGHGRHHPALRAAYFASDSGPECTTQPAAADELPCLVELVAKHEGERSAAIVRQWLTHPSTRVWSVRADDAAVGFLMTLRLSLRDRHAVVDDPIVESIFTFLETRADCAEDDEMLIHRTIITRDDYQSPSIITRHIHAVISEAMIWHGNNSPTLGHVIAVYGEPEIWEPIANSAGSSRLVGREVNLDGRRFAAFHRVMRISGHAWLAEISRGVVNALRQASVV